jgi:hypothetical protein
MVPHIIDICFFVCIDWSFGPENAHKMLTRLSTLLQCIGCVVALRMNSLVIALYITKVYTVQSDGCGLKNDFLEILPETAETSGFVV